MNFIYLDGKIQKEVINKLSFMQTDALSFHYSFLPGDRSVYKNDERYALFKYFVCRIKFPLFSAERRLTEVPLGSCGREFTV